MQGSGRSRAPACGRECHSTPAQPPPAGTCMGERMVWNMPLSCARGSCSAHGAAAQQQVTSPAVVHPAAACTASCTTAPRHHSAPALRQPPNKPTCPHPWLNVCNCTTATCHHPATRSPPVPILELHIDAGDAAGVCCGAHNRGAKLRLQRLVAAHMVKVVVCYCHVDLLRRSRAG